MAGKTYIGNSSDRSVELPSILIGDDNGLSKDVQKIYVGDENNRSVKVWPSPLLPLAYQQCEYIYNTNHTEYIDTGIYPDSNTRCWVDVYVKSVISNNTNPGNDTGFLGTTDRTNSYGIDIYGGGTNYTEYCNILFGSGSITQQSYRSPYFRNIRHTIEINRSGGYAYIDDVQYGPSTQTFSAIGESIYLFVKNYNGTPGLNNRGEFYCYQFKVWQNNVLIRDMYPCYLKSDPQTIGMYDLVNDQFYTNAGTGIFYKGPNV